MTVRQEAKFVGINSGSGISLSRYCMTCRILGLLLQIGFAHNSPSFKTRFTSSALWSPCNLTSSMLVSDPFCQYSTTQSTNIVGLSCA
uniref:Uncharacterized protein n=1 Tax=Oryza punctata TaxID=4537 RepID=A0A0E0LGV3_ORYPU